MGVAQNDPLFVQIFFLRFYQLFFRNAGLQHKLLVLTESTNILYWKSAKKVKWAWSLGQNLGQIRSNFVKKQRHWYFNGFFHILHEVYIYKQEVVVIEIPDWKLKTKLNTIFEGN